MNKYRCNSCKKEVLRDSNLNTIKSYCETAKKFTWIKKVKESNKDKIFDFLKNKKPDYRFKWQKTQNWIAVYETPKTLSKILKIPLSSVYRAVNELNNQKIEGFTFGSGLVYYEYRTQNKC